MKTTELFEQLQRRKSPEELAAIKAAPDYWKVVARKEFNVIMKKYGAISKETFSAREHSSVLRFDRAVSVLVSGENSITLHRDTRGPALLIAVTKWLHGYTQKGFAIKVKYFGVGMTKSFGADATVADVLAVVKDQVRLDELIKWHEQQGERGAKMPLRFNLVFSIHKLPAE